MKKPYLKRLGAEVLSLLLSWRETMPRAVPAFTEQFCRTVTEIVLLGVSLLGTTICICLPFAFWLAPLFLWIAARQEASAQRRQDAIKRLREAMGE